MSNIETVLSFDPASTRNLGWSYLRYKKPAKGKKITEFKGYGAGTIIIPSTEGQHWKVLWPIFCAVDLFLSENMPDTVVLEKTSNFKGSFITGQVSYCIGAILSVCGKHEANVRFLFPSHVKKTVALDGKATKTSMKKAVFSYMTDFNFDVSKFDSNHAIDAMGNIICLLIDDGLLSQKTTIT